MRALWLAAALAEEFPVIAVVGTPDRSDPTVREDDRKAGRKAVRKASSRKSAPQPGSLTVVLADEELPLGAGAAGAVVLAEMLPETPEVEAAELARVLPLVRAGGIVLRAEDTRKPETEAQLARSFLTLGITHITQDRPRDGALLTWGRTPHPAVLAAVLAGPAAG
jgi:hypothetical protein